jgi:hypothetical protein
MSLIHPIRDDLVKPNILCALCTWITKDSFYIQQHTKYGHLESKDEIFVRCNPEKNGPEKWYFYSYLELRESYHGGCHMCTMLWLEIQRSKLIPETKDWKKPWRMKILMHDSPVADGLKIRLGIDSVEEDVIWVDNVIELTSFRSKNLKGMLGGISSPGSNIRVRTIKRKLIHASRAVPMATVSYPDIQATNNSQLSGCYKILA